MNERKEKWAPLGARWGQIYSIGIVYIIPAVTDIGDILKICHQDQGFTFSNSIKPYGIKQYGTSKLRNPLTSVNTTSVQFNKSTEFEIMLISNNKY